MKVIRASLSLAIALAFAPLAHAIPTAYPTPGVENKQSYVFKADKTGDITAYFAGSTANYTNEITLLVNGVASKVQGLNNHKSKYGDMINFGKVNAGDVLVFKLVNLAPGNIGPWYSDIAMNGDGVQHIYSSKYVGDSLIPAGTFVAFEDLPKGGNLNYFDENFVFTNVATTTSVPEPASLALLAAGVAGFGATRRRARAK